MKFSIIVPAHDEQCCVPVCRGEMLNCAEYVDFARRLRAHGRKRGMPLRAVRLA